MVIRKILIIIESVLLNTTAGVFLFVVVVFILTLGISSLINLSMRVKRRTNRKVLNVLYSYMLEEVPLIDLYNMRMKQMSMIDGFSTIMSTIKGAMRERMSQAVSQLGLIPLVERGLKSWLATKRIQSCHTLGVLGSKEHIGSVQKKLNDRSPRVAASAIIALGEIGEPESVPAILEYFKRCSQSHAWLIAAILQFFGTGIYEDINRLVKDPELQTIRRIFLIKVISSFRLTQSLGDLQSVYTESEELDVRISALTAIGEINDVLAVKTVIDALSDSEWQIRAVACNLIGEMSIKGASYRLVGLLKDLSWHVRKNAASALVRLGKIGIIALIDSLDTDDPYARDMAVQTLEERGIIDRLITQLSDSNRIRQNEAYKTIKYILEKGYRNYLDNYRTTNTALEKLLR